MSGDKRPSSEATFTEKMDKITGRFSNPRGSAAAKFKAHLKLDNFSETVAPPETDVDAGYQDLCRESELASMAVMLHCANDVCPMQRVWVSSYNHQIAQKTIRIAAISFGSDEIGPLGCKSTKRPLRLTKDDEIDGVGQTIVHIHPLAEGAFQFDPDRWVQPRLDAVRAAIDQGAEIISLSEFDFPIRFGETPDEIKATDTRVLQQFQAELDRAGRRVFLIAGSRHEPRNDDPRMGWNNVAKVLVSKQLDDTPLRGELKLSRIGLDHRKLVSASSAGEEVMTPIDRTIHYYETSLGVIGILICVDAYSPDVLLSLVNSRDADQAINNPDRSDLRNRIDYIFIPSYNRSRKLYYACQVLSLLCETTVVLIDGWGQNKEKKRAQVEMFVCGRAFSDIAQDSDEIGALKSDPKKETIGVWELNLDFVRNLRQRKYLGSPTWNNAEELKATISEEKTEL